MPLSPSPLETHELMTVQETAEYLRIPKPTAYYLLQKGELPGIQIGGRWRVKRSLLDRDVLHIEPEDTVQKQVNMLIAPQGEQRDNMSLIQRLLGWRNTKIVVGDNNINNANIIVLDLSQPSTTELQAEPLSTRIEQNFPPEAHIVVVGTTEQIQENLTHRRNSGVGVTLLSINPGDKAKDVQAKVRALVSRLEDMPVAA